MQRSFTDRVLGGVCGGMAASLPVNAWLLRIFFVILTPISLGIGALAYLALWWLLPLESLISERSTRFINSLFAGLIFVVLIGAWVMSRIGELPANLDLAVIAVALMSVVFFIRQWVGR